MLRFILLLVLFLLSLLTVFRAPTNLLWYVSILVTEFSWLFIAAVIVVLFLYASSKLYSTVTFITTVASLLLFAIPIVGAFRLNASLKKVFANNSTNVANNSSPFSFQKIFTGITTKQLAFKTFTYDTLNKLSLDFYPSEIGGNKPCIIVVHGGSWAGGDSRQLHELNSELAKAGYHVASINYRLAPKYKFPAPIEDVKSALSFLKANAGQLFIDINNLVLLGRSAGGQIVLSAAYTLKDTAIKGVISFYGPADMVWGYANPTNPLVLNSRKIMEDYLGGTFKQVPQQYVNSSPTETASANAVPTLLIYGENDPLVSHLHGNRLDKKLDQYGIKHYDINLPWATHGFDWTLNGPGGQISTWAVMRFLETVLTREDT
jgi:acetyl esterase/lipase